MDEASKTSSSLLGSEEFDSSVPELELPATTLGLAQAKKIQVLALICAVLWVCFCVLSSLVFINAQKSQELDQLSEKAGNQARFIAQAVYKDMFTAEQLAFALSYEADIIALANSASTIPAAQIPTQVNDRAQLFAKLEAFDKVNKLFSGLLRNLNLMSVFLLDAKGNCIASSQVSMQDQNEQLDCIGSNYKNRQYFNAAKSSATGRQFAVGKRVPLPSIFFAHAVYAGTQFVGAAVVRLDTKQVLMNMELVDSTTWLVDKHGFIISANSENWLLHHLGTRFAALPDTKTLEQVYKLQGTPLVPLSLFERQSSSRNQYKLQQRPIVFAREHIEGDDFEVWHGFEVSQVLLHSYGYWAFCGTVIFIGLLIILVFERTKTHQQKQAANLDALSSANRSLKNASHKLFKLATTDHLTQISSRGYFMQRLSEVLNVSKREQQPLALIQLDIDYFKRINDNYGHPAGDAAIAHVAAVCKETIRSADLLGRIGGEEFAIGLINCDRERALAIAEKLRCACQDQPALYKDLRIKLTCSIGVSVMDKHHDLELLICNADKALYQAKNAGRNQVHFRRPDELGNPSVVSSIS